MRKFLVVVISIITVLVLSSTILYISITNSLSEKSINNNVKENLVKDFMYDDNGNNSELFNEIIDNSDIDRDTLNKIMENENINESISEIVSSVYNYNLTGNEDYKLSEEVIVSMIEDNIDELAGINNQEITEEEKEEILKYVKDNSKELVDSLYGLNIGDYR